MLTETFTSPRRALVGSADPATRGTAKPRRKQRSIRRPRSHSPAATTPRPLSSPLLLVGPGGGPVWQSRR